MAEQEKKALTEQDVLKGKKRKSFLFLLACAVALIAEIVFIFVFPHVLWAMIIEAVFLVGIAVLAVLLFLSIKEHTSYASQLLHSKEHLLRERHVVSKGRLAKVLEKKVKVHKCVANFYVENLYTELRDFYGDMTYKKINDIIFVSLQNEFPEDSGAVISFANFEGFYLYVPEPEGETKINFQGRLDDALKAIKDNLKKDKEIPTVQIFSGYVLDREGFGSSEMLEKSFKASLFQEETLASLTALPYDSRMDGVDEELFTESLRRAIEKNEFSLRLQGIYDLKSKEFAGLETLVRWEHPERGTLAPASFLFYAHRHGMGADIDKRNFSNLCALVADLKSSNIEVPLYTFHVYNESLAYQGFVDYLLDEIASRGLSPKNFALEIEADCLEKDPYGTEEILKALHENGFSIVLAGVFEKSFPLKMISRVAVDYLRIGSGIGSQIGKKSSVRSMVKSVVDLAHGLGIKAIVVGVENEDDLKVFEEVGPEYVQGFYFSRPMTEEEYKESLAIKEAEEETI